MQSSIQIPFRSRWNTTSALVGTAICLFGLAGCASSGAGSAQSHYAAGEPAKAAAGAPAVAGAGAGAPPTGKSINLTPYTTYTDELSDPDGEGGAFADAYTRLIVASDAKGSLPDDQNVTAYRYKPRNFFERYLWGQQFTLNFTIAVSAGNFKATAPLTTVNYASNNAVGEQWAQTVYHTDESYPLFLVSAGGGSATPNIKAELKGSINGTSQVVGSTVQAIVSVASDVSPQSKIVTELSKSEIQKQAAAIDSAISKLFGESIDEEHWADQDLRFWQHQKGVLIRVNMPKKNDSLDSTDALFLGEWRVTFEDPRPSIFVDWHICGTHGGTYAAAAPHLNPAIRCADTRDDAQAADYRDVDPASVLQFPLTNSDNNLGQISNYLASLDWYKTAIANMTDTTKADAAAADFCKSIRNAMTGVGLSTIDANIVVWSVYNSMTNIPQPGRAAIWKDPVCAGYITTVDASRATSNQSKPTPPRDTSNNSKPAP